MSHTPGPWTVANNKRSVLAGSVKINQSSGPCAACVSVERAIDKQLQANARLIASAPKLLAALVKIRAELCRRHSPFVVEMNYAYINEAIAEAKGD